MSQVFNRDLKNSYSWLPKNKTSNILNINASGRWSLITAIWSDGQIFSQIVRETVDKINFQKFIWLLHFSLKSRLKIKPNRITITLDNASVHAWESTRTLLNGFGYNTRFLVPYSPTLAPVEGFFHLIKAKIRAKYWSKELNFNKDSGINAIHECISWITKAQVRHLWKKFVKIWKNLIISYKV